MRVSTLIVRVISRVVTHILMIVGVIRVIWIKMVIWVISLRSSQGL